MKIDDLEKNASPFQHHGEILQDEAERLARVLTQSSSDGGAVRTLAYAIREIARNVIEHSEAEGYRFAAQWWPATGEAEIAIEDEGIGLAASFLKSGRYAVADDAGAVNLAIAPGVTSAFVSKHSRDEWANSGYGLYMTRGLCGEHGRFVLISETAALIAEAGSERFLTSDLPGTTVVLRLNAGEGQLEDRLDVLRKDARVGRPSKASVTARVRPKRNS